VVDHLLNWDIYDVFTLVLGFEPNGTDAKMAVLLKDWPTVSIADIKTSNAWYNTNTSKNVAPWVRQNLELSHRFILDSCNEDMKQQLTDQLLKYSVVESGGPLTFKVLMDLVQVNSERAIKHLISCVKNMDVKNFDGENIVDVVSQIRGAHSRLMMVSFGGAKSAVPITFCEDVMDVLQTTSTPVFNEVFDYKRMRARNRMSGLGRLTSTIEDILDAALEQYNEMMQDDSWLGVKNKAKETAFVAKNQHKHSFTKPPTDAARKPPTCFNCGQQGHVVKDCTKPLNREKQKELRNNFRSQNRSEPSSGGRGPGGNRTDRSAGRGSGKKSTEGDRTVNKFAPPGKNENGHRHIQVKDGVLPHKWNPVTKRWDRQVAGSPSTVSTMTASSGSSVSTNASQRAAFANLQRTVQQSVQQTFATLLSEAQE